MKIIIEVDDSHAEQVTNLITGLIGSDADVKISQQTKENKGPEVFSFMSQQEKGMREVLAGKQRAGGMYV